MPAPELTLAFHLLFRAYHSLTIAILNLLDSPINVPFFLRPESLVQYTHPPENRSQTGFSSFQAGILR